MKPVMLFKSLLTVALILVFTAVAFGQAAELSGVIHDKSGAVIPGASVTITNQANGIKRVATTNNDGFYNIPFLSPGGYKINVQAKGFQSVSRTGITLSTTDRASLDFVMEVGKLETEVTVEATTPLINQTSGVGTLVDQRFVENIPLNGRTFQSLLLMTAGVVYTADEQGQLSINGQRTNANYFTIDGVSANIGTMPTYYTPQGVAGGTTGGTDQSAAGAIPGYNVYGGTGGLMSMDELQEVSIQTAAYSAKYGRQPGGQVSLTTRGGNNKFHGSLYDYLRNSALDANENFYNMYSIKKPPSRSNNFGGTLSGPIFKNRTFFLFSYEGLRLSLPQGGVVDTVPASCLHKNPALVTSIQKIVDAFPLPNSTDGICIPSPTPAQNPKNLPVGYGYFISNYDYFTNSNSYAIRIDHVINSKLSVFGRYNHAPSYYQLFNQWGTPSGASEVRMVMKTATFGADAVLTNRLANSFRFNWSRNGGTQTYIWTDKWGVTPVSIQDVLGPKVDANAYLGFYFPFPNYGLFEVGPAAINTQRQWNLTDDITHTKGTHTFSFGTDIRVMDPKYQPNPTLYLAQFDTFDNLLKNYAYYFYVTTAKTLTVSVRNFSFYANDSWRVRPGLTLNYGLRWEINPAPQGTNGNYLTALKGFPDLTSLAIAPPGTPLYPTRYNQFAPRIGATYQLRSNPGWETILRGGWGLYYDLGAGTATTAAWMYPYRASTSYYPAAFNWPVPDQYLNPPSFPTSLTPPFTRQQFTVFAPDYALPRTQQYSFAVEQSLGREQSLTLTYVGNRGARLLQRYYFVFNKTGVNSSFYPNSTLNITRNDGDYGGYSRYNALQVQFMRRMSHHIQALVNYTFGHATDSGSNDNRFNFNQGAHATSPYNYGDSDFDRRHIFNLAAIYEIPTLRLEKGSAADWLSKIFLKGWSTDYNVKWQSGAPFNPTYFYYDLANIGGRYIYYFRLDRVPGQPLWVSDPYGGHGMAINPAAFTLPQSAYSMDLSSPSNGNVGRNTIRIWGLSQVDFAVRRDFPINERVTLQFSGEVFNILNQASFSMVTNSWGGIYNSKLTSSLYYACGPGGTMTCYNNFPNTAKGGPPIATSSGTFGEPLGSVGGNSALGVGLQGSALSSRYAIGGPRSMQFSLRLRF